MVIVLTVLGSCFSDGLDGDIQMGLSVAGDNAGQIKRALIEVDEDQSGGMRFLVANMPSRDLRGLSGDYLLENIEYAYKAFDESAWKEQVPNEIFLNDVLPYAVVNERRDDWRKDFYEKFKPLVSEAKRPGKAAVILNQSIYEMLDVHFSRKRPKADQSSYESIEAGMASCTGLSILLVDACRAVGIPARLAGTPLWSDDSGNHSWVEVWDGGWHYTGGDEPDGDELDKGWFTGKTKTAVKNSRMNAIYATSFKRTDVRFPLVWDESINYVYAVNVTDRYTANQNEKKSVEIESVKGFDVEASLHAVDQLKKYLRTEEKIREVIYKQDFADVALTREDAKRALGLLWADHVEKIKRERAAEMANHEFVNGEWKMPFFYSVNGEMPKGGRSLYISMHGGGNTAKEVNDRQWENQKKLYSIEEGVYFVPRAPSDDWNMWFQGHMDELFDKVIETFVVFENVNPNRVYLMGYSAGGDGVYQLAPRMADRWAAASMMAGHPNDASPVNLYNTPFTIHMGADDAAYDRNKIAVEWGKKLDDLQAAEPGGYVHWTKIYEGRGHWIEKGAADALGWMAKFTREPNPKDVIWRQDTHSRFYWLECDEIKKSEIVRATIGGQKITVAPGGVGELKIRLNDIMVNLDEDVCVVSDGEEKFNGRVDRTIAMIAKTLIERGDPSAVYSGEVVLAF